MVIVIFLLYLSDLKMIICFTSCLKTLLQNMDKLLNFRDLIAWTLFLLTKAVDQRRHNQECFWTNKRYLQQSLEEKSPANPLCFKDSF